MKNIIIIFLAIIIVGVGAYFLIQNWPDRTDGVTDTTPPPSTTPPADTEPGAEGQAGEAVIGKSVEGRDIKAYTYGTGETKLLFVGGIHGGYSWNTALVAYELMDYLETNPEVVPENVSVTVIPVVNPDGLSKVVTDVEDFDAADVGGSQAVKVSGRFNAHTVDLNRNFDCGWKPTGIWQTKTVSGGSAAFSEPETQAIKQYVETHNPDAAVIWYSAAGGVFSSQCGSGVSSETRTLNTLYANASDYPSNESFDFYETSGDMGNWLVKNGIPAINVLLSTHESSEWDKNQAGVKAVLEHYGE